MNKERLLKLATHLESGKLGHKRFDFAEISCGTAGCAMGELPFAFKSEWVQSKGCFEDEYSPKLRGSSGYWWDDVRSFFDVSKKEMYHLFYHGCQEPDDLGGTRLGKDATKEQVASNIRAFVAKMESA